MKRYIQFIITLCFCLSFFVNVKADEIPASEAATSEEVTTEETTTEITTEQPVTVAPPTEQPTTEEVTTTKPPKEEETTTKPTKNTPWTKVNGVYYNDKGEIIKGAIAKGMDVSKYQGKIDWEKVKKSDVSFVIIRCGYGSNYVTQDDQYFKENVEACKKYGIPYGIYLYSYATNQTMAKSEVQHVLRLLKAVNAKPQYPIYLDMEDAAQWSLSAKKLGNIASYFCNTLIKKGYSVGVYANTNWWLNKLTDKRFEQWNRWVAQYNSYCLYPGPYVMWQYSSKGKVSGVNGNVDMNLLFRTACTKGHNCKWVATKKATVLSTGTKKYICQTCGHVLKIKSIAKLKPKGKLNKKTIVMKVNKKYTKLQVKNLARGDSVKRYQSSNRTVARVTKKGVIVSGNKKGKAIIKVVLQSGKVLKVNVKVKK